MLEHPDYPALVAGQTLLIEEINSGATGLPVLTQLLQVGQNALGAAGMSFAEYGLSGGRIVAATGAAHWALGCPVHIEDPENARLLTGLRTQDVPAERMPGELASQLREHGLGRMIVARVELGGMVIGTLHAHYSLSGERGNAEHHAVLAHLASWIALLYSGHIGLPINQDGPVLAALGDGLAIVDREGMVRLWNRSAEQVTGIDPAQVLNQPLPYPMPTPGGVIDHQLPDGRWLRITCGELPGMSASRMVLLRDITEQRRREDDRDLFLAVTSHELRTPVTVIKGYADTLNDHWDSLTEQDRRQAARVIGQRTRELARLVERLLCTTVVASTVGGSPPVPFDLAEALRAAVAGLPADLRQRLRLKLPDKLPPAKGDPASVTTVLTELVTNAEKYSPAGTPIEVEAAADEGTVLFRVNDCGIGVRPEHVERAFERFWQAESGDRRRYSGAGLGLYLVRTIIERQNGWVSLRPRQKGGTVAEVRLPRG